MHFPRLRLIWSRSLHATADIFQQLKANQEEPDPVAGEPATARDRPRLARQRPARPIAGDPGRIAGAPSWLLLVHTWHGSGCGASEQLMQGVTAGGCRPVVGGHCRAPRGGMPLGVLFPGAAFFGKHHALFLHLPATPQPPRWACQTKLSARAAAHPSRRWSTKALLTCCAACRVGAAPRGQGERQEGMRRSAAVLGPGLTTCQAQGAGHRVRQNEAGVSGGHLAPTVALFLQQHRHSLCRRIDVTARHAFLQA